MKWVAAARTGWARPGRTASGAGMDGLRNRNCMNEPPMDQSLGAIGDGAVTAPCDLRPAESAARASPARCAHDQRDAEHDDNDGPQQRPVDVDVLIDEEPGAEQHEHA